MKLSVVLLAFMALDTFAVTPPPDTPDDLGKSGARTKLTTGLTMGKFKVLGAGYQGGILAIAADYGVHL